MLQTPTPEALAFPRLTGRRPKAALAYRATRVAVRVFGERRVLGALSDLARLFQRLAYESAGRFFGEDDFHGAGLALDDDMLGRAVPADASVIDIGCGTGRWCRHLAPSARRVVGVDHDATHIAAARRSTTASNVSYRVGDVWDVVGDDYFDTALLVHILEHIEEPVRFLQKLHSVAGRIAVEVPDFENDPVNLARLTIGREFSSDADHLREYTEATLLATLSAGGWHVESLHKRGGAIAVIARPATSA